MNVKESVLVILAVVITFLSSCESIVPGRYGFDIPVGPGSTGSSTVEVDFTVGVLRLAGSIIVTDGTVDAELMSPSGAAVFSVTIDAPGELCIDRSFPAEEGVWRLRYVSRDGKGYIRMYLDFVR